MFRRRNRNMMRRLRIKCLLLFVLIGFILHAQPNYRIETDFTTPLSSVREGFTNPPPESRLRCYWWWLNSMATRESITRDLEEMKAKGYGGASIVDAGSSSYSIAGKTTAGPVFMSEAWMDLYRGRQAGYRAEHKHPEWMESRCTLHYTRDGNEEACL